MEPEELLPSFQDLYIEVVSSEVNPTHQPKLNLLKINWRIIFRPFYPPPINIISNPIISLFYSFNILRSMENTAERARTPPTAETHHTTTEKRQNTHQ
jgi:hypothetical protein